MNELLDLMSTETWFNAQQAVEKGFADKEMFAEEIKQAPQLVAGIENIIPSDVISKLANAINTKKPEVNIDEIVDMVISKMENTEQKGTKDRKEAPTGFGAFCF